MGCLNHLEKFAATAAAGITTRALLLSELLSSLLANSLLLDCGLGGLH